MRRALLSLMMILCTVVWSAAKYLDSAEEPVKATIVTVQRGDVHQVAAIIGRLAYTDEKVAYAAANGVVSRICVQPGQRVGKGEALIRLDATQQENVASAFAATGAWEDGEYSSVWVKDALSMENAVVRAEESCTIRQVLVNENMPVAAGTPVVRVSSNVQEIICSVADSELQHINEGMWAWLSAEGESLGFAKVVEIGETSADAVTGSPRTQVKLLPDQHIDLPERTAVDADVYIAGSDDVLTLPVEAISERGTVWWVSDGRCTEIPAEIVMTDEILAWVHLPEGISVAIGEFQEGQSVEAAQ